MRRSTTVVAALATAVLACSDGGTDPAAIDPCEADPASCEPPPPELTIPELESAYLDSLNAILDRGADFAAALEWVRQQDRVVASDADDHTLYFRIEGSEPTVLIDLDHDDPGANPVSPIGTPGERTRPPTIWTNANIVVGKGTDREDLQNRKKALFLQPYEWQFGERFAEHMAELRQIPDYAHSNAIWDERNGDVDPFLFGIFDTFDAVFISTHGATFDGMTWVSTGVLKEYPVGGFDAVCREIGDIYRGTPGARCATIRVRGREYVAVGLQTPFFRETYGNNGGLQRAVVYMGGCNTGRNDNWYLADALSGSSSAYFGWDGSVWSSQHPRAIYGLLYMLIQRRSTTSNALHVACLSNRCGGPMWGPAGAKLRLYPNGQESKKLRLYDPPTLKRPGSLNAIQGLMPGDTLLIKGLAGDGIPDSLRMEVDVTGVIDPDDTSGGPPVAFPPGDGAAVESDQEPARSQLADAAHLYDLRFRVDGQAVAADNLGSPDPDAQVSQLNATTWRYAFTAPLPFDLPLGGQTSTLRVEAPLPEGGLGDYEVDVFLQDPGCTYSFDLGGRRIDAQVGDEMTFNTDNGRLWQVRARRPSQGWDLTLLPPDTDVASRPDAPGSWPMVIQGDMGLTDPGDQIFATDPPPAATFNLETLVPGQYVKGRVTSPVYVVSTSDPRTLHADWDFQIRYRPGQFKCVVGG
ncbi:MAG: hypothetical protein HKN71_04825 [Gemmatimonadetes bacterium]|nr:hypothetical protein [Gemmatimonadota bacterium]